MSGNHQKEAHGVRSKVLTELTRGIYDRTHHQKDLGPIFHHQSQRCDQADFEKCAISAGPKGHGRQYD